jgi:hypothetical protein
VETDKIYEAFKEHEDELRETIIPLIEEKVLSLSDLGALRKMARYLRGERCTGMSKRPRTNILPEHHTKPQPDGRQSTL